MSYLSYLSYYRGMIKPLVLVAGISLLSACATYDGDEDWTIRPGEATDSIAVEQGPGDQVCVRDPDTGERHCVPALNTSPNSSQSE